MTPPRLRASYPSIQMAVHLGRPIQSEDFNRERNGSPMSSSRFMAGVFLQIFHRAVPTVVSNIAVLARLDAGRWIADCPMGCGGAEKVSQADPVFLCLSCGSDEKWWPVAFPKTIKAIERELTKRADPHAWTWRPGEGMAALRVETVRLAEAGL